VSAANRPAAPAPTTTRSLGGCGTAGTVTGVHRVDSAGDRGPRPWLRHDSGLAHDIPGHPERPQRIVALETEMERHGWFGWEPVPAPVATNEQLTRVHSAAHVEFIAALSARGGGRIDLDTAAVAGTYRAALHAAGGAVALVDRMLAGGAPCGVAALRPPGHHASAERAMGFCFFNNVAVAAAHARAAHRVERVLIFDWDVHHGNGTNDIFHADPSVLFCSIHESPLYPGTGPSSDVGAGEAAGFTVNLPVPGGSGDDVYGSLVEHVVAPLIRGWRPALVLISAGFDAHQADPLASCRLTEAGFATMTASLRRACADVGAPLGAVLEGGYSTGALASSMAAVVPVLGAPEVPDALDLEVHPLAARAQERLSRWWPDQFGAMRRT
jgi:acetoin utilization deacetylase AcuC-like enzyme